MLRFEGFGAQGLGGLGLKGFGADGVWFRAYCSEFGAVFLAL